MTDFTPLASAIGGSLIGLAALLFMDLDGRIMGVSGIVSRLLPPGEARQWTRDLAFVLGLFAVAFGAHALFGSVPGQTVTGNLPLALIAGFLTGFGAVLGSGCTSGHGVCGLARLSRRSFAATGMFMGVAMLTVFVMRHVVN